MPKARSKRNTRVRRNSRRRLSRKFMKGGAGQKTKKTKKIYCNICTNEITNSQREKGHIWVVPITGELIHYKCL